MNTPPNPGIPALLLATASKFGFRLTVGRLGTFVDDAGAERPLALGAELGSETTARVEWSLDPARNCAPFIFGRLTYHVLHEGTAGREGNTVELEGKLYRVEAQWDGAGPVAVAVPVVVG